MRLKGLAYLTLAFFTYLLGLPAIVTATIVVVVIELTRTREEVEYIRENLWWFLAGALLGAAITKFLGIPQ